MSGTQADQPEIVRIFNSMPIELLEVACSIIGTAIHNGMNVRDAMAIAGSSITALIRQLDAIKRGELQSHGDKFTEALKQEPDLTYLDYCEAFATWFSQPCNCLSCQLDRAMEAARDAAREDR